MGQSQSTTLQDYFNDQIFQDPLLNLFSSNIQSLTYEDFIKTLGELNQLAKQRFDKEGKQLIFAVKKGSDSTILWKATVQVACVQIHANSGKINTFRLLSLYEFLKVYETLKEQSHVEQQTRSGQNLSVSEVITNIIAPESTRDCCICFERKLEVILPCMHSYCLPCIEEWNALHGTCPICREKLASTDDSWVISEVPEAEEISNEIKLNLLKLTESKGCTSSSSGT